MNIAQKFSGNLASAASVVALCGLLGCASGARVDKDPNVNLGSYQTFGWFQVAPPPAPPPAVPPAEGQPAAPPPQEIASIAAQRTRNEVAAALQAKGYTLSDTNPDFRVNYVVNILERPRESPFRIGIGAGRSSGNASGSVGVSVPVGKRTETTGILTIDVIDPKRNAQVWTGTYEGKLFSDQLSEENTKLWVGYVLEKFPKQGGK